MRREGSALDQADAHRAEVVPIHAGERREFQSPMLYDMPSRVNADCGETSDAATALLMATKVTPAYLRAVRQPRVKVGNRSVGRILPQRKLVARNQAWSARKPGSTAPSSVGCAGKLPIQ